MYTTAGFFLKRLASSYQSLSIRHIGRHLLPYLGSAFILWLLLRPFGLHAIWELLRQVNGYWLSAGFGWYLLTNVCRAYRFSTLLPLRGAVKPLELVPDMIILSFLNNMLPARTGELFFPIWLRRRHQTPIGQSLAVLFITRLFDFLAVASLFLIFTFLVHDRLTIVAQQAILATAAILLPALGLLAILPWLGQRGLLLFDWLLVKMGLAGYPFSQRLRQLEEQVVMAVVQAHQGRVYFKTFLWSLLAWLCTFAWFTCFLQALALPTPYTFVVVGATFAVLANAIPFITVGGFGAHDAGWAFGFSLLGMAWETAVITGFAVNVLTIIVSIISSGGVLLADYLRKIGQQSRRTFC